MSTATHPEDPEPCEPALGPVPAAAVTSRVNPLIG